MMLVPDAVWKVKDETGPNWCPPHATTAVASDSKGGSETRPKNIAVYYIIFAGLPA